MKKIAIISLSVLLLGFCIFTIPAFANNTVAVFLDDKELTFDVSAQTINGRTMVPMRKIFEEFGAVVEWNGDTQTVTATKGDIVIVMQINHPVIIVSGESITLDVAPQLLDGRTLVPVRAVAEGLDAEVEWNEQSRTVLINTKQLDMSIDERQALAKKSNVLINFYEKSGKTGYSSGVLLNSKGDIATCYHVFANDLERCEATLYNGKKYTDFKIIGYDATRDIIIINVKIDNTDIGELSFGDDVKPNDKITYVGNPNNVKDTLIECQVLSTDAMYYSQTYYKLSPYIANGGSGGGIYDDKMHLIGIVASSNKSDNASLAVPSDAIKKILSQQMELSLSQFQTLVQQQPQIRDFVNTLRSDYTQKFIDNKKKLMFDRIQVSTELSNEDEVFKIFVMVTEEVYNNIQNTSNSTLKDEVEKVLKEMLEKTQKQYPNKDIIFDLSMVEIFNYEPSKYEGKATIDYNSERNLWAVVAPICNIAYTSNKETLFNWY